MTPRRFRRLLMLGTATSVFGFTGLCLILTYIGVMSRSALIYGLRIQTDIVLVGMMIAILSGLYEGMMLIERRQKERRT